MKFLKNLSIGAMTFVIASCVSLPTSPQSSFDFPETKTVKFRFQNMLGLEIYSAGCSMINDGGVERMCQYSLENPADLVFQVGPSFSPFQIEPISITERQSKRNALWKAWEVQGVKFYSVDAFDLTPSVPDFMQSHEGSTIRLLSSNLKKAGGEYLFEPMLRFKVASKSIGVLSFTEPDKKIANGDWKVESPVSVFKALAAGESQSDLYYVLGSLSKTTQEAISQLTSKPILFLGGELKEQNSIEVEKRGKYFFVKAPDLGRGFGELAVGKFEKDVWGRTPQANLGGLDHSFRAKILKKGDLQFNPCSEILKTTKPQSLSTEALEKK